MQELTKDPKSGASARIKSYKDIQEWYLLYCFIKAISSSVYIKFKLNL